MLVLLRLLRAKEQIGILGVFVNYYIAVVDYETFHDNLLSGTLQTWEIPESPGSVAVTHADRKFFEF